MYIKNKILLYIMVREYYNHKFIKPNSVEKRLYQELIISNAINKNTLVVLPTGLGKTIIALGVSVILLERNPDKKILIMAPTKPLVEQHLHSFEKLTTIDSKEFVLITGARAKEKRKDLWKDKKIIFATPQVVVNDLKEGFIKPEEYSLVIYDEAHKAVGDYAYTEIAKIFKQDNENVLFLALTASPGSSKEKIGNICGNLYIDNVEIKNDDDEDVIPYIHKTEIEWVKLELDDDYKKAINYLDKAIEKRMNLLKKMGIVYREGITKSELLELQKKISQRIKETKASSYYVAASYLAQVLKLQYASELLQSHGALQFYNYIDRLINSKDPSKAIQSVIKDENVMTAYNIAKFMIDEKIYHPKMYKLLELLNKIDESKKVIVFTQFVDTVNIIVNFLNENKIKALKFTGQRKGFSQKQQIELIKKFRDENYKVLVATSVAEEGLDIPKVDVVVFYEPIPSEIRTIQRRGRTGRFKKGKVYILIAKNTIDEAYYWASKNRERKMKNVLKTLKKSYSDEGVVVKERKKSQKSLDVFVKENMPIVYVDNRENGIIDKLRKRREVNIEIKQLPVGDFLVSERIAIERKTNKDFVNSIIDGRLFKQVHELIKNYELPVLLLEGCDLYNVRNIHPNAVRGAISSITIKYGIPIIYSQNEEDSVEYIVRLALREHEKEDVETILRGHKKVLTFEERQIYVLMGLPYISEKLAMRLLEKFKTIKNIANATIEELTEIKGIGKEKAEKIYSVFNESYFA